MNKKTQNNWKFVLDFQEFLVKYVSNGSSELNSMDF